MKFRVWDGQFVLGRYKSFWSEWIIFCAFAPLFRSARLLWHDVSIRWKTQFKWKPGNRYWIWSMRSMRSTSIKNFISQYRYIVFCRKQPDLSLCPVWLASPKSSAGARVIGAASRAPIQDGAVVGTLAKKNFAAPPKHPILEDLWRSSSTACVYLFLSVFGKSFNKFMCILFRLFHFVLEVSNPFACHLHYIMKSVVICTYYREQQKHRCFKASCTVN
jgi:hypothetical protein